MCTKSDIFFKNNNKTARLITKYYMLTPLKKSNKNTTRTRICSFNKRY